MKIMHYSLGLPPVRTGGLTAYVTDLMAQQTKSGNSVYLVFPGRMRIFRKKKIYLGNPIANQKFGISTIEMFNALPLALSGGIKEPDKFMRTAEIGIFQKLLTDVNPDIIHIHTFMGLPEEFLLAAQYLKIPVIFTTHDYFGLAPEPTFFFNGHNYNDNNTTDQWVRIGRQAMSIWKLRIFQSKFYPQIRKIFYLIRDGSTSQFESRTIDYQPTQRDIVLFSKLRTYYNHMFSLVSYFLFNSEETRSIYEQQLGPITQGEVLSLSNSRLHSQRLEKTKSKKIRLGFIGQDNAQKGFPIFLELSKKLDPDKYEFHTYGYAPKQAYIGIVQHGRYSSKEIETIYKDIDVTIVPSQCHETFGFVAVESVCFDTPVLVSSSVGSKDLLPHSNIFNSIEELVDIINNKTYSKCNYHSIIIDTMKTHEAKVEDVYHKVVDSKL